MLDKLKLSRIFNLDIFLALISGLVISTLVMLLPLGVLIGLFEVIDPAFVAYEYVPEEILFIPWLFCAICISFVNLRSTYLLKNLDRESSTFMINTPLFYTPPNERFDQDEYPGKKICNEFISYLETRFPDTLHSSISHKDYGWSFIVENDINSIIEVSFAFADVDEENPHSEKYEISIDYSLPLNPLYRISFSPNTTIYKRIEDSMHSFLITNGIRPDREI